VLALVNLVNLVLKVLTELDLSWPQATTALEKSTVAFERIMDGAISLAGTGSGKVPLLLPPTQVDSSSQSTPSHWHR
jgi:hypothetical protein